MPDDVRREDLFLTDDAVVSACSSGTVSNYIGLSSARVVSGGFVGSFVLLRGPRRRILTGFSGTCSPLRGRPRPRYLDVDGPALSSSCISSSSSSVFSPSICFFTTSPLRGRPRFLVDSFSSLLSSSLFESKRASTSWMWDGVKEDQFHPTDCYQNLCKCFCTRLQPK